MFARAFVQIIISPRIFRDAIEIRPMPAGHIAGLLEEIIQTIATLWIVAGVDLERIQGCLEVGDLGLCGSNARLLAAAHDLGINNRRQRCQNNQHQQHLHQGKTPGRLCVIYSVRKF